jgi:hypothetical protein
MARISSARAAVSIASRTIASSRRFMNAFPWHAFSSAANSASDSFGTFTVSSAGGFSPSNSSRLISPLVGKPRGEPAHCQLP